MGIRPSILVYAEDERLRQTIERTLSANYRVYSARDLRQASALFEREQIDAVMAEFRIVDIMDGALVQFISRIQAHSTQAPTRILLLSTIPEIAQVFTPIPPSGILPIPFTTDQLHHFITLHLGTGSSEF